MAAWLQGDAGGVAWTALSSPGIAESEGSASRELLFEEGSQRGSPSRELILEDGSRGRSPSQEFSLEFREGLIWFQVKVPQSSQPLNFLLDTGAGVSVVNLSTAKRLGIPLGKQVQVEGVGARSIGYWPEKLSASADQVGLPRDYLAVDLNELGDACNCHVDGLLGADFFQGRIVQLDFSARKVRLLAASPSDGESLPLRFRHGALQVPVSVNHAAARWARLDTGCASSLQWAGNGKTEGRPQNSQEGERVVAVGLAGLSVPMEKTTVQLGSRIFENVQTGVHAKQIFAGEAGLLGSGLLSRFERVTIDTKSARLLLPSPTADR